MNTRSRIVFLFFIKRTKLLQNGEAPIYLKIKVGNDEKELAILNSVNPRLWSVEKNGAVGTSKEAKAVNKFISYVKDQLNEQVKIMREEGIEITATSLKNAYLGIKPDEKKIGVIFKEHNDSVKKLIGNGYTEATHQRYETCLFHIHKYIKWKYNTDDLTLDKLDLDFIKGFEVFLKSKKECVGDKDNCSHNTTMKYIKNFKKIVKYCFENGWMKSNPFATVKLRIKKVDKGFITDEEINRILKKEFSCERLRYVADIFLFGCFTGFAYADLKKMSKENLITGIDGQLWITANRKKTDMESRVPVLPIAKKIIEKYEKHPYCREHNLLLPVMSNQKLNAYLKEIADLCGIHKNLTSHIARHTFATTITLNNDVPIESVSKMLGHSSISMTQIYAKLLDKKVAQDMSKVKNKYSYSHEKISLAINPN